MLGHADAKTTSIYLNSTFQGLRDSIRRFGTGSTQSLHNAPHGALSDLPPPVQQPDAADRKPLVN